MIKFVVVLLAFCLLVSIKANPLHDELIEGGEDGTLVRQKRVTCDVLSASAFGVSINDSACATHCLVLGKKGGRCNNGVCVCR